MSEDSKGASEAEMAGVSDATGKRVRLLTHKGFQNTLLERTTAFNKQTKLLQGAIASLHSAMESGDNELVTLKRSADSLEINKLTFESSLRNVERLFSQDRWGESAEVEKVVKETGQKYAQYAESALQLAAEKLDINNKDDILDKGSGHFGRSARSRSSHVSSTSARISALAEAAAAKEEEEYEVLMAERESQRKLKEAEEDLSRAAERAEFDRDTAVLTAKKKAAVAQAKLEAIERSINDDRGSSFKSEDGEGSSKRSKLRTKSWVKKLQQDQQTHLEVKASERRKLFGVRFPDEQQRVQETESNARADDRRTENQEVRVQNSESELLGGMNNVAKTNEKLASNLARMSLPKCHPDLFSGDATMFHPWKGTFKGMLRDADVSPEQEMNYLHMYTRVGPQNLVNSFRKRQHGNTSILLKELWAELEKRYGNAATITNAFLGRLRELAKFGEREKIKLQAFSDLCVDVASQIEQLPGLGCLNYPTAMRPILHSLPETIRKTWEKKVVQHALTNHDAYPDFKIFATTIEQESILRNHPNVTAISENKGKEKDITGKEYPKVFKGETEFSEELNPEKYCTFHSNKGHNLQECKAFARKTLQEKMQWVRQAGLCFRCLMQKHLARDCKMNVKCTKCGSDRHLEILHMEKKQNEKQDIPGGINSVHTKVARSGVGGVSCSKIVLLDIFHPQRSRKKIKVYALIDEQSNVSMISPKLADELGISGSKEKYLLTTCSASKETKYGRRVSGLRITSTNGVSMDLPTLVECDNIPTDKREIPTPQLVKKYKHLREAADELPPLHPKAEVQLLIGRDAPEILKVREVRNGPKGAPWAHKLAIGWTVCGRMCVNRRGGPVHVQTHRTIIQDLANYSHARQDSATDHRRNIPCLEYEPCPNKFEVRECYFETESSADVFKTTDRDNEPTMSIEDQRFVRLMETNIHKNEKGNWEMPLPLRKTDTTFPNNRVQAVSRMRNLQQSFKRKPQMEKDYFEFTKKLLQRGHAVPLPSTNLPDEASKSGKVWYLPHFGVYHPRKPGKIRVVFDSSVEFQGTSLNKELLSGPDILNNPLGILIRFRCNNVAVVCDIEQMFYNFYVEPAHRDLQRFLWFEDNDKTKDIMEYQMTVHSFGNTSSPSVAMFGLRKTADDGEEEFGHATKEFVKNDFYVDDGLTSCSTSEEAIDLIKNSQLMMATANLRLHRIASNSKTVMQAIPLEDRADSLQALDFNRDPLPSQLSLGVMWNMQQDILTFRIALPEKPFTRRGVLSVINSIYDPLGLAIPVTLIGRLLLRQLTTTDGDNLPLGWDDPLPAELQRKWNNWKSSLIVLTEISIPRSFLPVNSSATRKVEIHAFSDASDRAIGVAVYIKLTNQAEDINVSLVYAQAKLAPKQATTIPRLELCAAVLAVKAVKWITRELKIDVDEIVFYTDSRVVLGYIQNESRRFYVYVANRIQIIRSMSDPSQWRHVDTTENPADIATRGKHAKDLVNSPWFTGPKFLKIYDSPESSFSVTDYTEYSVSDDDPEIRSQVINYVTEPSVTQGLGSDRFSRFSRWSTLRRALANLIIRAKFKKTCHQISFHHSNRATSRELPRRPTAAELEKCETIVITTVQREQYSQEFMELSKQNPSRSISVKSSLYRLDPFIDNHGVLRVGGRLRQAEQLFEEKHPAIIPKETHLAELLVKYCHDKVYHQGRQITYGAIRNAGLWIVDAKRMVSKIINECVIYRIYN